MRQLAVFQRKAKLSASLNYRNIAAIYGPEPGEGNRFPVLEYVKDETLRAKLSKRPLPITKYLQLSVYSSTVAIISPE
jgi:peptidoglycan hydrolase-like protein with peptidoglycan-binding domain